MRHIKILVCFAFLLLTGSCSFNASPKYKYPFTICAIFKDEAPWLKEWLVYHHDILGFDHFYLYNNDSTDDYLAVLKPFIDKGIVELIDWSANDPSHLHPHAEGNHMRSQMGAYNHCMEKALGEAKWVALIDIDEFIVPVHGIRSFHSYMHGLDKRKKGSVKFSWRMFGTSDIWELKPGELLTERLTRKAADDHPYNNWYKCMHRPEAAPYVTIHDAPELVPGFRKRHCKAEEFRIHHYWSRTGKACLEKRGTQRPEPFLDSLDYEEDRTMAQYIPALKKAMAKYN